MYWDTLPDIHCMQVRKKCCKAFQKWECPPIERSIYSTLTDFLFVSVPRILTEENRGWANFMSGTAQSPLTCNVSIVFL